MTVEVRSHLYIDESGIIRIRYDLTLKGLTQEEVDSLAVTFRKPERPQNVTRRCRALAESLEGEG